MVIINLFLLALNSYTTYLNYENKNYKLAILCAFACGCLFITLISYTA